MKIKTNRYRLQARIKKDLARRFIYKQNELRSRTGWFTSKPQQSHWLAMPARAPFANYNRYTVYCGHIRQAGLQHTHPTTCPAYNTYFTTYTYNILYSIGTSSR